MIRQFYPKSESILRDNVLEMKAGCRFVVFVVEQIIDAGRGIQIFDQVVAVQGEIDDAKTRRVRSPLRIARTVGVNRVAGTGVLKFQSRKNLVLP
jgi:hypothetical protein